MLKTSLDLLNAFPARLATMLAWIVMAIITIWPDQVRLFLESSYSSSLVRTIGLIGLVLISLVLWLRYWTRFAAETATVEEADTSRANTTADSPEQSTVVNQTHSGSGNIINAGSVSIGRQRFELTNEVLSEIDTSVAEYDHVVLTAVGSQRSLDLIQNVQSRLERAGKSTTLNYIGILSPPLPRPLVLEADQIFLNADI